MFSEDQQKLLTGFYAPAPTSRGH